MPKPKSNGTVLVPGPERPANGSRVIATSVPPAKSGAIMVPAPEFAILTVKVVGDKSLICSAFPEKILRQLEDKKAVEGTVGKGGKQKKALPARNYDKEYEDALYPLSDGSGYGFPSIAFKRAMVGACRNVDGLAMTEANRYIYVESDDRSKGFDVVRIHGKPQPCRHMVRLNDINKTPDIRYRAEFDPWHCILRIKFNATLLSPISIINLLQWAGLTEGVGEMRPSAPKKPFDHGTFHPVFDEKEKSR